MPDRTTEHDKVYIYALQRISDGAYLYIGSSNNPKRRFACHKNYNPYPLVREGLAAGDIKLIILLETNELNRIEAEFLCWQSLKSAGNPIVNCDPRVSWTQFPKECSAEHRQKISKALRGRKHTQEHTQKVTEAQKGRSRIGRPMSADNRRKLIKANTGRIKTEEEKQKISESNTGRHNPHKGYIASADTRRKRSESLKGHVISDETKRKIGNANRGKTPDEDARRKMSESAKAAWERKKKGADND